MYGENCKCPNSSACAFYNISRADLENDVDEEIPLTKDRESSRKRHHSSTKAKNRSLVTASFLSSKADKIPNKGRCEELSRKVEKRACHAQKESEKLNKRK